MSIESEIRWGTGFDNQLQFTYPKVLDDAITYRKPVPGSSKRRNPAGVTDAWEPARDYVLAGRARWFQDYDWGGLGLQDFLDWAGVGNTFRFIPDTRYPNFYVDSCYLEEPYDDPRPDLEANDGSQSINVVIRQQAFDFTLAMRGLMFEYVPGKSITDPSSMLATYSRGSIAKYDSRAGFVTDAASGALRDQHFIASSRAALLEAAATNVVIQNRDLTNAAWTKTNLSAVKDQTGPDGVASSASKITASAGNGTCLQAITLGSSARYQSAYVKRITGSGTIQMTMDNGSTWTAVTVTSSWTRVTIPTQTLANPTVGFRIVTNGDAIAVDLVQNENQTILTSPIATAAAGVTRSADSLAFPHAFVPQNLTLYAKLIERGSIVVGGAARLVQIGDSAGSFPYLTIYANAGFYNGRHETSAGTALVTLAAAPVYGDTVELRLVFASDGSVLLGQSINGAAETVTSASSALTPGAAWPDTKIWLNSFGSNNPGINAFQLVRAAAGTKSLAEMRAA